MLPMTFLTGARGARVRNFALPVAVETTAAAGLAAAAVVAPATA